MDPKPENRPPRKRPGKRADLAAWLERRVPAEIGEAEWKEIQAALAPVSEAYLRRLLRESGVKLAPMVEGVRQETMESLERSLLALLAEYEASDSSRRAAVRRLVIEAKDHARLAGRKPELREEKEEMTLWMLTWLENPSLFPQWSELRKRVCGGGS
jgi:hypothetical protein